MKSRPVSRSCANRLSFNVSQFQLSSAPQIPTEMRERYLNSLSVSQEFFLEQLVRDGIYFEIKSLDNFHLGYAVTNQTHLIELYLEFPSHELVSQVVQNMKAHLNIDKWYLKSFDPVFSFIGAELLKSSRVDGFLFRAFSPKQIDGQHFGAISLATSFDISDIMKINDDFFVDFLEVQQYIAKQSLYVFKNVDSEILGCGILTRVIEGRSAVDIGFLVSAKHRRKGIGVLFANFLKNTCLGRGDIPIAGCSSENLGSKKTLESAGFITQYQLLELSL